MSKHSTNSPRRKQTHTHSEQWSDVQSFEGYYQVSTHSRIKSLDRWVSANGGKSFRKGRLLRPGQGVYLHVVLSKKGVTTNHLLHRLLAVAFIPNPDNKPEVNHKDGNKRNNDLSNLEWSTSKENKEHACRLGLMDSGPNPNKARKGTAHGCAKLTEEDIPTIRLMAKQGMGFTEIARVLASQKNITLTGENISMIVHRKTWRHVP